MKARGNGGKAGTYGMRKSALSFVENLMMKNLKSSLMYWHMYIKINFRVIVTLTSQ